METTDNSQKISAVLNTYNAEEHLDRVLAALEGFDEIVVCDMESTDRTLDIARARGCRIVTFPKGNINICEPARNTAIQSATNPWVLVVDADEVVTPQLRDYLYRAISQPNPPTALKVALRNMFIDQEDKSRYPDYHIRFFRRDRVNWPPTIHSIPQIDGTVDKIPSADRSLAMIHYPSSTRRIFQKQVTYCENDVDRRLQRSGKVSLLRLIFRPKWDFFKRYIFHGAIFRGRTGYIQARLDSQYRFMVLTRLLERQLLEEKKQPTATSSPHQSS